MIRTKLVATVGPACSNIDTLGALIHAGVDVFRLNFSHGTLETHAVVLRTIRQAAAQRNAVIAVMGDLCGPKIRVDRLVGGQFELHCGDEVIIQRVTVEGTAQRISCNYPSFVDEIEPGHRVLIDDGNVRLVVIEKNDNEVVCRCDIGGVVSDHKGINLPDTAISAPALTEKDRTDLAWAVENDLDYVALSFVRHADDVRELRGILDEHKSPLRIVSKIEKPEAIDHLIEIVQLSDVVLVARGDLGVEMDLARVPMLQKEIAVVCRRMGTPVIIATQMLQSMVDSPVATRAEVSDVANAILDHADAIMLSAETSIGRYPLEAARMTQRISQETELFRRQFAEDIGANRATPLHTTRAIVHATELVARELDIRVVAVWTGHGNSARLLSKHRIDQTIVALSPDERVCRQMAMYYGVVPVCMRQSEDFNVMLADVDAVLVERELAETNDRVAIVAGTRLNRPGETNSMLIHLLGEESGRPTT